METETTTWSEFPNGGKAIVEQILASKEINKSKRAGLWESQSRIQVGKLTIWVRVDGLTADGLIRSTSSMLDEKVLKTMLNDEEGDW